VLNCAHGYKEEQFSHLNSQESFGFAFNFASPEKDCVKGVQVGAKIKNGEKEG